MYDELLLSKTALVEQIQEVEEMLDETYEEAGAVPPARYLLSRIRLLQRDDAEGPHVAGRSVGCWAISFLTTLKSSIGASMRGTS